MQPFSGMTNVLAWAAALTCATLAVPIPSAQWARAQTPAASVRASFSLRAPDTAQAGEALWITIVRDRHDGQAYDFRMRFDPAGVVNNFPSDGIVTVADNQETGSLRVYTNAQPAGSPPRRLRITLFPGASGPSIGAPRSVVVAVNAPPPRPAEKPNGPPTPAPAPAPPPPPQIPVPPPPTAAPADYVIPQPAAVEPGRAMFFEVIRRGGTGATSVSYTVQQGNHLIAKGQLDFAASGFGHRVAVSSYEPCSDPLRLVLYGPQSDQLSAVEFQPQLPDACKTPNPTDRPTEEPTDQSTDGTKENTASFVIRARDGEVERGRAAVFTVTREGGAGAEKVAYEIIQDGSVLESRELAFDPDNALQTVTFSQYAACGGPLSLVLPGVEGQPEGRASFSAYVPHACQLPQPWWWPWILLGLVPLGVLGVWFRPKPVPTPGPPDKGPDDPAPPPVELDHAFRIDPGPASFPGGEPRLRGPTIAIRFHLVAGEASWPDPLPRRETNDD